jgi:hypothetical protein
MDDAWVYVSPFATRARPDVVVTRYRNLHSKFQLLATELQAAKSQLKPLRASSKIRVLELRDNPTAGAETVKMSHTYHIESREQVTTTTIPQRRPARH